MQELATLASIVAALSIGVVSPGPSFVMVARVAVASSRIRALATALGMGVGGTIFGAAALLGLQSVLLAVPALYAALKVLGGLCLLTSSWFVGGGGAFLPGWGRRPSPGPPRPYGLLPNPRRPPPACVCRILPRSDAWHGLQ